MPHDDTNGSKLALGIVALLAATPAVLDGLRHTGSGNDGLQVKIGDSPLDYSRNHGRHVLRLSLIDPSAPPPRPGMGYYAETGRYPAAEPGTVAFADFHTYQGFDGEHVGIDYLSVRSDMRGRKLLTRLLDELFERYADVAEIDFGAMMHDAVVRQYQKRRASQGGPRIRGKLW